MALNRMKEQSFNSELPAMKVAAELTDLSCGVQQVEAEVARINFLRCKQKWSTCFVDTSVLSWFVSGPGNDNGKERRQRDIDAFHDLSRLAALRLLKIRIPMSVLEELSRGNLDNEKTEQMMLDARARIAKEATGFAKGQHMFGVFSSDSSVPADVEIALIPDKEPAIPKEDRTHYLMACISHRPFVTMDYTLINRVANAIRMQIELIEGQNKQKSIPKHRVPLRSPAATPHAYLQQLLVNFPHWQPKLELARKEPNARKCEDLRLQYASLGQEIERCQSDSNPNTRTLISDWQELEQRLKNCECSFAFFDDWPPEMQPDCWKRQLQE